MSTGFGQTWDSAKEQIIRLAAMLRLSETTQRWIVAGSMRRLRPEVHDIDIVAIPAPTDGLFPGQDNALLKVLDGAMAAGEIRHTPRKSWGDLNRRFIFENHVYDLATCDEVAWPVLVAIKTGPERFTKGLVTNRRAHKDGMLPNDLAVAKDEQGRSWRVWRGRVVSEVGAVVDYGQQLTFDSAKDDREFIELCCGQWIEPKERR